MNRLDSTPIDDWEGVPHVRGDEPDNSANALPVEYVFPTCVGMNRLLPVAGMGYRGVPHVRGDEPLTARQRGSA